MRAERAGDRLDDAQVGLVQHDGGELGGLDAGELAGPPGDRDQRRRRPAEHRAALHLHELVADLDDGRVGAVVSPGHRADADRARRCRRPGALGSAAPTTAAPAPSPKRTTIERSSASTQSVSRSDATTSTFSALPARTVSAAIASA